MYGVSPVAGSASLMTVITPSLSATPSTHRVDVTIDGRAAARIECRAGDVHVGIAMLGGNRCIDVSIQPRTVPTLLRREARRRREDPNRWCAGVARTIFDEASTWGLDELPGTDRDDLGALLASLAFPIARLARRGGAGPVPHVPRWAAPALRAGSTTAAVQAVYGPSASRAMARALPQGMMPGEGAPADAAPDLRPLGLAVSLVDHLPVDRLATVLAGGHRWLPPHHWPADDDMPELRRLWHLTDAPTATALALDATAVDHGTTRLRRALTILEPLAAVAELTLARRIADLEEQATRTMPAERPTPVARRRPAPRRAVERQPAPVAAARPRRDPLPAAPRNPPRDGPAGEQTRCFTYPATVEIAHGHQIGEHRLVLPRDPGDLTAWGRRLSNCLADYAGAVRSGRSVVIGLEERGTLVAALELRDNEVRQFVGIANGRPSPPRRDAMEALLRDLALGGRGGAGRAN